MCIIVDTNTFGRVFDKKSKEHDEFKPVKDWIVAGNGMLVLGGSTYEKEIFSSEKYLKVINQLLRGAKAKIINKKEVDKHEKAVAKLIPDKDFDDKHIAAIVRACGCKLICTLDTRSIDYLREIKLYGKRDNSPRFYTSIRNQDLLVNANIAECCKPAKKTTKAQKALIGDL